VVVLVLVTAHMPADERAVEKQGTAAAAVYVAVLVEVDATFQVRKQ